MTTGPEIWEQTECRIDVLVGGMGTGGTLSGSGKFLKEKNPKLRIVGADPEGSLYHHEFYGTKGEVHPYKVEGVGEDFLPSTLDLGIVDEIVKVSDQDAFLTARRLVAEEGIFAGGSSGMAVFAACSGAPLSTPVQAGHFLSMWVIGGTRQTMAPGASSHPIGPDAFPSSRSPLTPIAYPSRRPSNRHQR